MRIARFVVTVVACVPFTGIGAQQAAARMPPIGSDSLASHMKGVPEGHEVHSLSRTATGYQYTERMSIPGIMTRTATVDLDTAMNVVRAQSTGVLGKRKFGSVVEYHAQRARGRATPLERAAGIEVAIDTLLPPGAFDGLALYPVLLSRPWQLGNTATIELFDTDDLSISRQTFRIVAREELQVPAGKQLAFRGELSTTQLPVTIWFSVARPHRLLKVSSANGETVLVH